MKTVLQLGDFFDDADSDTELLGSIPELDSMAVVSILTAFEERFDIEIDDDDLDATAFETLGALTSFVEQKLSE
ncbi:MAG: phosphopantetheine-binding protein [Pseudomonadota bacterium]